MTHDLMLLTLVATEDVKTTTAASTTAEKTPLTRINRVTPIIFATMDSTARAISAQNMAMGATDGAPTASHSATITLSTYIFVLLTVLSCMVGAVFSFICCKLMSSDRK